MDNKVKKLVTLAMFCAIAYAFMFVGRIPLVPAVPFLKYDPKDVVIAIGGFLFGPVSAFVISLLVSLIEMITVSETGPIGLIMNVLSTCTFACTAAVVYKKKHTIKGAVAGLVTGCVLTTGVMLLWNYLITPIYMGYPREAVAELLLPAFLPFNLLKCSINAALTIFLYKPVVRALRKSGLVAESKGNPEQAGSRKGSVGVMLLAAVVLATCILLVLVLQGII